MRISIIIICLLIARSSLSQTCKIEFKNEAAERVPYVSVYSIKTGHGGVADTLGILWIDPSVLNPEDSVLITALGYEDRQLVWRELLKPVFLKRKFIVLPEVVIVHGCGIIETWGTREDPGILGYNCSQAFVAPDQSFGRIIYPEGQFQKAVIESVSFYDKEGKAIDAPVRLRIFLLGKDSLPVQDYLTENIIVRTPGTGWLTVDLRNRELVVPEQGLAFVLELFDFDNSLFYTQKVKVKDLEGRKFHTRQPRYGFRMAREKNSGGLTLWRLHGRGGWKRWGTNKKSNDCGDAVCRIKVRVWR